MSEISVVTMDIKENVAFITINRPEAMNALNEAVIDQLDKRFSEAESNASVQGIVLQGAGKAFVAGADIRFFVEKIKAGRISDIEAFTRRGHELFLRIENSKKKTIAILDGLSLGGGSELALACQEILATPEGSMGFPETSIGIFPGLGGMLRFAKQVGVPLAKYYVFTGAAINATDANALGVVTVLTTPEEIPKALSAMIAGEKVEKYRRREIPAQFSEIEKVCNAENIQKLFSGQPLSGVAPELAARTAKTVGFKGQLALKMANEIIDRQAELTIQEGVELELGRLQEIFSTADALEGLSSSLERRRPSFKNA
jgi:enoyl-CoA hydratase/3-hydroxyacyl-CoA dehydrogenase